LEGGQQFLELQLRPPHYLILLLVVDLCLLMVLWVPEDLDRVVQEITVVLVEQEMLEDSLHQKEILVARDLLLLVVEVVGLLLLVLIQLQEFKVEMGH
jgi:hypothetical protein